MLSHTGGLPSYTKNQAFLAPLRRPPAQADHEAGDHRLPRDEPLDFPAGSRYEYSNTDNIVVAMMAEAATGRSL